MPEYEQIHKEMQRSGVTLSLLWVEYCEQYRATGELPYQSTQFNKYYADYVRKTKDTMHLNHKPGETMQVDRAGDTMGIVDTDTGELIPAYLFVAVLPYSGYAYAEAFLDEKQEAWVNVHVTAYRYFGGVTHILVPDNLKTGIIKNAKDETVLNRSYREMVEHYGTAVIPARPKTPKDKAFVEGSAGVVSTWIIAALRNRQFFTNTLNRRLMCVSLHIRLRFYPKAIELPLIRGCMAAPTSISILLSVVMWELCRTTKPLIFWWNKQFYSSGLLLLL